MTDLAVRVARGPDRVPRFTSTRRPVLGSAQAVVLGAVLLGAGLRVADLAAVGFGSDEAVYALQARSLAEGDLVVRAHPPLWIGVGAMLGVHADDVALRALTAATGVATIVVTYRAGLALPVTNGRWVGAVAAWVLAVMPFHVDVSRQFMLDGPAALATTVALLCVLRWDATGRHGWLLGLGVATTVAVLTKETSLLPIAAVLASLVVVSSRRRRTAAVAVVVAACSAVLLWVAAASSAGQSQRLLGYAEWQVGRGATGGWTFYAEHVVMAVGPVLVAFAALGAVAMAGGWHRQLLVACLVVPLMFYLLWPVKGYAYLASLAPVLALLGAVGAHHGAAWLSARVPGPSRGLVAALVPALLVVTVAAGHATRSAGPLPGRDGLPEVREAAEWIASQPRGVVMADNRAVANVVAFYARTDVRVVPGGDAPAALNPAYRDQDILPETEASYFVWSRWSARSQPDRSESLVAAARSSGARVGYAEAADEPWPAPSIVVWRSPR